MHRALLLALVLSLFTLGGATLVGRAIDAEIQHRVTFMRGGKMLDCERVVMQNGTVHYENCSTVP